MTMLDQVTSEFKNSIGKPNLRPRYSPRTDRSEFPPSQLADGDSMDSAEDVVTGEGIWFKEENWKGSTYCERATCSISIRTNID
jgi:hypothetical protein